MEIMNDKRLLDIVEAFLAETNMAHSSFGRSAMGDGALVRQLREGTRSLSLKNAERVMLYIANERKASRRKIAA